MKIEMFGTGCYKCNMLEANVRKALTSLGLQADLTKVTDIGQMIDRGVMVTPALAIDGEIVVAGRVASVGELIELISSKRPMA